MIDWKKRIESTLRSGMRFCFRDSVGTIPQLIEDEFMGSDAEPGFIDFVQSVVNELRKKCFMDGFVEGSKSCFLDMTETGAKDIVFDELEARRGAEKHWNEYDAP